MISFIIPVFNVEKYIEDCICSLIKQEGSDLEFIFIDDGSQDTSGEICECYAKKDSRIQVIRKKNEGVSATRNLGIKLAHNKWICFVDADDKVAPGFVSGIREKLSAPVDIIVFAHQNLDGVNIPELSQDGKTEIFGPDEIKQITRKMVFLLPQEHRDFYYDFGYTWGKLYRKELIVCAKARFPVGVKIWEDKNFNLQLLCYVKYILGVHEKWYCYRKNSNSAIHQKRPEMPNLCAEICKINLEVILNNYNDKELLERHKAFCISALYLALKNMGTYNDMKLYLMSLENKAWYKNMLLCKNGYLEKKKIIIKYLLCYRQYRILYFMLQKKIY